MSYYSRTALRELKKRYLNILKKCFLANLMAFSFVLPLQAETAESTLTPSEELETVVETTRTTVSKDTTIDLAGKNLTYTVKQSSSNGGVFYVNSYKTLEFINSDTTTDPLLLFENNTATKYGGAISNYGGVTFGKNSTATFTGNSVTGDYTYGGAIYNDYGTTITFGENSTAIFTDNSASSYGGAIFNNRSTITFGENSIATFTDNSASWYGGAILNEVGTITFGENSTATFMDNSVSYYGGAINNSGTITFNGEAIFTNNSASGSGGAIRNSGTITFGADSSVSFSNNKVGNSLNDIYNSGTINILGEVKSDIHLISKGGTIELKAKDTDGDGKVTYTGSYDLSNTILDISGDGAKEVTIENLTVSGSSTLKWDAEIKDTGDTYAVVNDVLNSTATGQFTAGTVNIMGGNKGEWYELKFTDLYNQPLISVGGSINYTIDGLYKTKDMTETGFSVNFVALPKTLGEVLRSTTESTLDFRDYVTVNKGETLNYAISEKDLQEDGSIGTVGSGQKTIIGATDKAEGTVINANGVDWIFYLESGDKLTLENLTIASAKSSANTYSYGGAIYNYYNSTGSVNLNNVAFTGNSASSGGAIYNYYGTITFDGDATFTDNSATGSSGITSGGAIYNYGSSSKITFNGDASFTGNSASSYGGAIYHSGTITFGGEATFTNNSASYGGAIYNNAGSITFGENSTATFTNNSATFNGGAIVNDYGTITFGEGSTATFSGNHTSSDGGAIYNNAGDPNATITFNEGSTATFSGNSASGSGGAIYNSGSDSNGSATITFNGDATFTDNSASYGGAIYNMDFITFAGDATFTGNSASRYGGAIYNYANNSNANATITFDGDATFTNNSAPSDGGAIVNNGGIITFNGDATFTNNTASMYGGAIVAGGGITFKEDAIFDGNSAPIGGAIDASRIKYDEFGYVIVGDLLFEKDAVFKNNQGSLGGAFVNIFTNTTFNGPTLFENNSAEGEDLVMGGAIANLPSFLINSSPVVDENGNMIYAKVTFKDQTIFKNNKAKGVEAVLGGAINNMAANMDFEKDVLFEGSSAVAEQMALGGAILTVGKVNFKGTAEFIGNKTVANFSSSGGAIYIMANMDVTPTQITLGGDFTFAANKTELFGVETPNDIGMDAYSLFGTDGAVDLVLSGDQNSIGSFEGGISGTVGMSDPNIKPLILKSGEGTVILGDKSVNENYLGDYVQLNGTLITGSDTFFNNSSENLILGGELKTHGGAINHKAIIGSDIDLDGNIVIGSATHYTNLEEMNVNNATVGGVQFATEDMGATIGFGSYTKAEKEAEIALMNGQVVTYTDNKGTLDTSDDEIVSYLVSDKLFTTKTLPEGKLATFKVTGALDNESGNTIAFKNANVEIDKALAEQGTGATYEFSGSTLQMPEELTVTNKVVAENMGLGGAATNVTFKDIEVKEGSSLDIDNKHVTAESIQFGEEATLKVSLNDLSDFGTLHSENMIGDEKANLELKLTNGIKQEEGAYQIFDKGNQLTLKENKLVKIIDQNDGSYLIGKKEVSELEKDLGLTLTEAKVLAAVMDDNNERHQMFSMLQRGILEAVQSEEEGIFKQGKKALKSLGGTDNKLYQSVSTSQFTQMHTLITQMLTNTSSSMFDRGMEAPRASVYTKGLYDRIHSLAGDGFRIRSKGAILGVQSQIQDNLTVGIGYAGTKSISKEDWRRTEVDSNTGFISVQYQPNNWWVNAVVTYSRSEYDEEKQIMGMKGSANYNVDSIGSQIMTGYRIKAGDFIINPEIGARYISVNQEGYTDSFGTTVEKTTSAYVTALAGVKVGADLGWIRPLVGVSVGYDIKTDDHSTLNTLANGGVYYTNGKSLDKLSTTISAGFAADISENASLRFEYGGSYRKEYIEHSGMLRLEYKF